MAAADQEHALRPRFHSTSSCKAPRRIANILHDACHYRAVEDRPAVPGFARALPSRPRRHASAPTMLDPVVVTATRRAERSFDVPAAVDGIDGATIREGQPAINLSESLVRVPGIFAANRSNYAQDLQHQPDSQDPLGLTRAQWEADPRQADPAADTFDTRKSIDQKQGGVALEHRFDDDTSLRVDGYGGHRQIEQYLALAGTSPRRRSGGVVDLDRDYGGASREARARRASATGRCVSTVGVDYDGRTSGAGVSSTTSASAGELDATRTTTVRATRRLREIVSGRRASVSLTAGVRASEVRFSRRSLRRRRRIPTTAAARRTRARRRSLGVLVVHASDARHLYASYGEGFETPTFAELAYRPAGPGSTSRCEPATSRASRSAQGDRRAAPPRQPRGVRDRHATTRSSSTRRPAAARRFATRARRGVAASRSRGTATLAPASRVHATTPGSGRLRRRLRRPARRRPSSRRATSCPASRSSGVRGGRVGAAAVPWLDAGAEVQSRRTLYVNDRNTEFAPAYTIGNLRVGRRRTRGDVGAARSTCASTTSRPQLRRLGDRRRHQRPLLRAGAGPQRGSRA